jgi:CRAL/TRIO domain
MQHNKASMKPEIVCKGHTGAISSLSIPVDGWRRALCTGSHDGTFNIWNKLKSSVSIQSKAKMFGIPRQITASATAMEGHLITIGTNFGNVRLYGVNGNTAMRIMNIKHAGVPIVSIACAVRQPIENLQILDPVPVIASWRSSSSKMPGRLIDGNTRKAPDGIILVSGHSATIQKYITSDNVITTTSVTDDLVYCIRAGQIDDVELMKAVSVDQMVSFFLYAKEVNALVANDRSLQSDKLLSVLTANDLTNVKLLGGSADFRKALSAPSKQANDLYPATAGPTLLLNLPPLLNALVKLFTPLFPPAVNERLKFAKGPVMKEVKSLTKFGKGGSQRQEFLSNFLVATGRS